MPRTLTFSPPHHQQGRVKVSTTISTTTSTNILPGWLYSGILLVLLVNTMTSYHLPISPSPALGLKTYNCSDCLQLGWGIRGSLRLKTEFVTWLQEIWDRGWMDRDPLNECDGRDETNDQDDLSEDTETFLHAAYSQYTRKLFTCPQT